MSAPDRQAFNRRLANFMATIFGLANEARELSRQLPEVVDSLPENDMDRKFLPEVRWVFVEVLAMDGRIRSTPDIDRIVN